MLGNWINLGLGVIFAFCVYHIRKQLTLLKQARLTNEPLYKLMFPSNYLSKNVILNLIFRIYCSKLVQALVLILRVIIAIACIICVIGVLLVLNSDYGDLLR
jgi:hypothetical protein